MLRPFQLTQWQTHLTSRFADLPTPVVAVLAAYSFGLLLAHVSGLSTVVLFLARHLDRSPDALRKRLAEFYKAAPAKSGVKQGQKRRDFAIADCFAPLLRWIRSLWAGRHRALALDVTNLFSAQVGLAPAKGISSPRWPASPSRSDAPIC